MSTHQNLEVLFHQLSALEKRVVETEKRATKAEEEARHAIEQATKSEIRVAGAEALVASLERSLEAEKEARTALKPAIEAEFTTRFLALEHKIGSIWKGVTDRFKGAETVAISIDKSQKVAEESAKNNNKRVNNLERFMNNKLRKIYGRISDIEKRLDPANRPRPSPGP